MMNALIGVIVVFVIFCQFLPCVKYQLHLLRVFQRINEERTKIDTIPYTLIPTYHSYNDSSRRSSST